MPTRINPWSLVLVVILAYWLFTLFGSSTTRSSITYTDFLNYVEQGKVARVILQEGRINGFFKAPERIRVGSSTETTDRFTVVALPSGYTDPQFTQLLRQHGVVIENRPPSIWPQLLYTLVPILVLIGFWWFFFMRAQGGAGQVMQFGQSRARLYGKEKRVNTTFKDVAGHTEAKRELMEVVDFLKNPQKYIAIGAEIPKGVLLVGPPGTGKTLLTRAVAGEAGVPFFSVSASEFMEMFVGVGASRVRTLFEEARRNAPAIIFIDELDSIGRKRGAGIGGGHDEREQTLNQILSEMDGFEKDSSVIVLAATNRPDILDPALLRPGRFDRQVVIGLPTLEERKEILQVHMRGKKFAPDVDVETLARLTPQFSGADLKNLVNEAALQAARENANEITQAHFQAALDKIMLGLERGTLKLSEQEKRAVAYHEAGHAIVGEVLPYADKTEKVSIVPRGMALGVRWSRPEERILMSKEHLEDSLAMTLAGRAAEELFVGTITTGAAGDFKQATALAKQMVLDWGMGDHFKNVAWGSNTGPIFLGEEIAKKQDHSEETSRLIDADIRAILDRAYERAKEVLAAHAEAVHKLAAELLEREVVQGERVREILAQTRAPEAIAPTTLQPEG
ncbi:MAG: ATP-dependent zinc metalloprotease FtsH [Meiothermus sp.]|uniref:ATP-dependent zinc metalloprotease FtsH n=1 Tax=Meiothermus sp. TaxID=1955249 RepID=UPI0025EC67D4|nr:ATP-dependent zinc metalloprotease FtsH [Meiothermus sp.]MCS7058342.1 ATP-dependent zinc metalloprotease FtsH [Meiothermus sp.]MCS7194303.1 ATP-dependent zinc metalloprotease FtsH [Meiothermus sp.]MCX7740672.1 ATP-dependent zinc metalloprotease FtsH [Meiothermus sp.]MDW8090681.1 ATP-dependent zinc metalloprotease FtsH [Meiothermus sp.]